jgi:chitosanase
MSRPSIAISSVALVIATALGAVVAASPATGTQPPPAVDRVVPALTSSKAGLAAPGEKQIAMELVSSAENSTLDWRSEYGYIEDIGDGRGYTGGLIGFCSGTGDMLALARAYVAAAPRDPLARFLPALRRVDGSASHRGLGPPFVAAWKRAARDPLFRRLQMRELDRAYFDPAVNRAKADGLGTLGQFIYYDAIVMHGPGPGRSSFGGLRARAIHRASTPAEGGSQVTYLNAFLDVRRAQMKTKPSTATPPGSTTSSAASCAKATSPCARLWPGAPTATATKFPPPRCRCRRGRAGRIPR